MIRASLFTTRTFKAWLSQLNPITSRSAASQSASTMKFNSMDSATKQQYLADDPPTVVPLPIKPHFEALNDKEQRYAHFISRAAFAGTRIVLRQVSPESEPLYDFIISVHNACNGIFIGKEEVEQ